MIAFKVHSLTANPALLAFGWIDQTDLFFSPSDGPVGAGPLAVAAAVALFGINGIVDQGLADSGRTMFLQDVGLVFLPEVAQGGQNRIGRRFPQPAEGGLGNGFGQLLQKVELLRAPAALR